jgi:hypothetical protein
MLRIQQLSSDPYQRQTLLLPDGSELVITMKFVPMQYGWFFESIVWNDFTLYGLRISNQPNMLHQWKNILPFGLACFSKQSREPSLQDDFFSGASTLYVLTEEEVSGYTEYLNE